MSLSRFSAMTETYLWHLWPGRHWPLSPKEEKSFVSSLRAAGPPATEFERGDVTAVLNILRLGLNLPEMASFAPGLDPARLLGAYLYLAHRRDTSAASFAHLMKHHTMSEVDVHALRASRLVPVPTYRAVTAIRAYESSRHSPADALALRTTLTRIKDMIAKSRDLAAHAESTLAAMNPVHLDETTMTTAVRLGRALYDPYDDCLWSAQFYLPQRVTDLVPGRVADLLEETEQ